jgi:hypothetical protein
MTDTAHPTLPDDVVWTVRKMLPVVNSQRLSLSARSTAPLQTEWIKRQLFVYFPSSRKVFGKAFQRAASAQELDSFWEWLYTEIVFPAMVDPVYNGKESICAHVVPTLALFGLGTFDRRDRGVNKELELQSCDVDNITRGLHLMHYGTLTRLSFIHQTFPHGVLMDLIDEIPMDTQNCYNTRALQENVCWKIVWYCAKNHVKSLRADNPTTRATFVFASINVRVAGCSLAEVLYGASVHSGWASGKSRLTKALRDRQKAAVDGVRSAILYASKLDEREACILRDVLSDPKNEPDIDIASYVLRQLASMNPDIVTEFATLNALIFEEFASMAQKETNEANREVALKTYFEKQDFVLTDIQSQT